MTGSGPLTAAPPAAPGTLRAPALIVAALAAIQALVAAVNLSPLIDKYTVAMLLDINGEANLVAWLSSAVLLAIAGGAAAAAAADRASGEPRRRWLGWAAIAGLFVLLSADEAACLHELAGEQAHRLIDLEALPSLYTWVLVVAPVGLVIAGFLIRWFAVTLGLRSVTGRLAIVAVALWIAVPLLEALDPSLGGPIVLSVVEESLEAVGEALMLAAVVHYLAPRLALGTAARASAVPTGLPR